MREKIVFVFLLFPFAWLSGSLCAASPELIAEQDGERGISCKADTGFQMRSLAAHNEQDKCVFLVCSLSVSPLVAMTLRLAGSPEVRMLMKRINARGEREVTAPLHFLLGFFSINYANGVRVKLRACSQLATRSPDVFQRQGNQIEFFFLHFRRDFVRFRIRIELCADLRRDDKTLCAFASRGAIARISRTCGGVGDGDAL